jgi:hypothetical protein
MTSHPETTELWKSSRRLARNPSDLKSNAGSSSHFMLLLPTVDPRPPEQKPHNYREISYRNRQRGTGASVKTSLMAQRHNGIDAHGAPRGDVARSQRHNEQRYSGRGEDQRIGWCNTEEHR